MKIVKIATFCITCSITLINSGCHTSSKGVADSQAIVSQFGDNLNNWATKKEISYRNDVKKQCDKTCRVSDVIMEDFARNKKLKMDHYVIDNYLNGFQDAIKKGDLSIMMYDYKVIEEGDKELVNTGYNKKHSQRTANKVSFVSCQVSVRGPLRYNVSDLYYLQGGKIVKIDACRKSEKGKINIDLSDIEDESTLGFSINHDQYFPIGASVIGQKGWFIGSLDWGLNLDSRTYTSSTLSSFKDLMNFEKNTSVYNPRYFLTLSPGVFLKYLSISCGVGFVYTSTKSMNTWMNQSADKTFISSNNTDDVGTSFMLFRPHLRGYIPLSESCNLSIGVGYDIVPKMKELNGYNVSLGFHFYFDN